MSDENLCAHFYPFLTKLANKDWYVFPSGLLHTVIR